ncbi:MAG: CRISPR-associated endonuclease Cas2 [Candidatus Brocadia sp. UTAMX2]|jgi:CRISPR-associated protein Cas2|nr:MAG: CRISPR-associated endonuclease Cas2 [Candidatus Brocadia sp. UTAMX2]
MLYVVSYDIPDTGRRTKLAKALKDFGDRVHYSVFECMLDSNLLNKMVARIKKIVLPEDDSVRIYAVCASCERAIQVIGRGKITSMEDVYIV